MDKYIQKIGQFLRLLKQCDYRNLKCCHQIYFLNAYSPTGVLLQLVPTLLLNL